MLSISIQGLEGNLLGGLWPVATHFHQTGFVVLSWIYFIMKSVLFQMWFLGSLPTSRHQDLMHLQCVGGHLTALVKRIGLNLLQFTV